jgi:hypothetical protein
MTGGARPYGIEKYKPDWPEAKERWTALWEGRHIGRPCIAVKAPRKGAPTPPPLPAAEPWRRWIDPEWIVANARAQAAGTCFGGEALPSCFIQAGWLLCYHAPVQLLANTIWIDPIPFDIDAPPSFSLDTASDGALQYERVVRRAAEELGPEGMLIQPSGGLPANDLLSLMVGTENFLMAIHDNPAWLKETLARLAANNMTLYRRYRDMVRARAEFWYGVAWDVFWGPEPFFSTQSDISCMLSPEQFEEFVLPEILRFGQEYGRLWYHLDGPGAICHLPLLLRQDAVKVIQWVPGAGAAPNGPAWIELYKQVQRAGRIVHIRLSPELIEPLARELNPSLVCYTTQCGSQKEAEDLLEAAGRWIAVR